MMAFIMTLQQAKKLISGLKKEEYKTFEYENVTEYENDGTRILVYDNGDIKVYKDMKYLVSSLYPYDWEFIGVYFNVTIGGVNYERYNNAADEEE